MVLSKVGGDAKTYAWDKTTSVQAFFMHGVFKFEETRRHEIRLLFEKKVFDWNE